MTHTDLSQALAEELVCVGRFCDLLAAERDALCSGDLDQVSALAQDKLVLGQRLQQLSVQREHARNELTQAHPDNVDPFSGEPFDLQWEKLSALLEQARETNRINGLLVTSRLADVSNAINALHGAAGASPLYQSDGSARPLQSQSRLANWSA